ncbi:hypothetical protein E3E31_00385 [Thermococcus sp. M39]|uniref:hypothetical protein n=1 Tax=unclassified Thermococcus TaxID=2627626 RepID=UPI001439706E|nr:MULTISPECIES: hypothetical protein [unclassified Thermococcus]NJE07012.1 hypothetical protein [Thermococcus sp. M39]NJE12912.1 hypothetical protein [Thermococcus sp. LS2]
MNDLELKNYITMLRARMSFAEKLYGIRMNYLPLVVEDEIIILDKNDGKIKRLRDKKPLSESELKAFLPKIRENIEKGIVDLYLTMNFQCIHGPGE